MRDLLTLRLEQCCRIVSGGTPDTFVAGNWGGDVPWATPKDLSQLEGPTLRGTQRMITAVGLASCSAEVLPPGSVLFSSRAPIGLVAINGVPMATNQGFKSFIPSPDVLDAAFLYWWLKANRSRLQRMGNGATFKELSKSVVGRIAIRIPPLPEQRRIAAILDQADELRRKRREALGALDTLAAAIFIDMFGDPVANPKGWPDTTRLGDVADIVSGVTVGRKLAGKATRVVPFLAVSNVQDRSLELSVVKTIEATEEEIARFRLQQGDLLLTEGGDPDKLGRGTLWSGELPECIHQNHVFRVRVATKGIEPLFLSWLVGSQRGKRYFLRSAKQTTGIASINMTQLRSFRLLMPPLALQEEFRARIGWLADLRARCVRSSASLEELLTGLRGSAFRGRLDAPTPKCG